MTHAVKDNTLKVVRCFYLDVREAGGMGIWKVKEVFSDKVLVNRPGKQVCLGAHAGVPCLGATLVLKPIHKFFDTPPFRRWSLVLPFNMGRLGDSIHTHRIWQEWQWVTSQARSWEALQLPSSLRSVILGETSWHTVGALQQLCGRTRTAMNGSLLPISWEELRLLANSFPFRRGLSIPSLASSP